MRNICKSQRIKERQLRRKKPRKPLKSVWFRVDPDAPCVLILRNGKRLRQKEGLDLFFSMDGDVYSLTKYGLRKRRINFTRKRRYGLKSCNGVNNGQTYPYVTFRSRTYRIHIYMALAWIGPRPEGHEIDHLNGNIDDWRLCNLQYVTYAENRRRAAILRRLRHAAQTLHDPSLDPINKTPEEMAEIYRELDVDDAATIMDDDFKHHREY